MPFPSPAKFLSPISPIMTAIAEKLLGIEELRAMTSELARGADSKEFCARLQERLALKIDISEEELERIPTTGATVVVANHSFGLADAVITSNLLFRRRSDIRYLANEMILQVDGVRDLCFPVDLRDTPEARRTNARSLRDSLKWLDQGGLLVVFPAGEVAHWRWSTLRVTESKWNENPARLAQRSGAKVLPMWIDGHNSPVFHLAGLAHPALRTAMLPREFVTRRHFTVRVRIGNATPADWVERRGDDATDYLRNRCESLRNQKRFPSIRFKPVRRIITAVGAEALAREISSLPKDRCLASGHSLQVWHCQWKEAPAVLREIGRLREITFRAAGEGTGKSCDLDRFDPLYGQLVLWNAEKKEIAGGYRFSTTDSGERCYSTTLFKLHPQFFERMGPAIELGRSFITLPYQRSFEPLMLLWKAIGTYIVRHPRYTTLYGPVSISNAYSPLARASLIAGLKKLAWRADLAEFVRPRVPFRPQSRPVVAYDIDELDALVAEIEREGKGIPILVKHYLKLGGKLAGFNLDPAFAYAVDGLIVVNLLETPRKLLERYMGRAEAAQFLEGRGDN
jgi:putative hemolysin